jgi:hypothetical protein
VIDGMQKSLQKGSFVCSPALRHGRASCLGVELDDVTSGVIRRPLSRRRPRTVHDPLADRVINDFDAADT